MRNPERIDRLTEKLNQLWHRNPDMRLGQLITALAGNADPVYVEDGKLEKAVNEMLVKE
jgi:hypothetical protein